MDYSKHDNLVREYEEYELLNLSPKDKELLYAHFPDFERFKLALNCLAFCFHKNIDVVTAIRSINFNLDFFKDFDPKSIFGNLKDFELKLDPNYRHPESVFQINIIDKKIGKQHHNYLINPKTNKTVSLPINPIASFSFYFIALPTGIELRINNLQGRNLKGNEFLLNALNRSLGLNWRVFIVRNLIRFARSKGYRAIGELPMLIRNGDEDKLSIKDKERYIRELRQYLQAYIKSGMQSENIDSSLVPEKEIIDFKAWIKKKIANKHKGRLRELKLAQRKRLQLKK